MSQEESKAIAAKFNEPAFGKKVAIVTGGSRGIGKAIVRNLVQTGHAVVFTYNSNEEAAKEVAEKINKFGTAVTHQKVNVTDAAAVQAFIEGVIQSHGQIDVLVNNAGMTKDGLLMRMSESDWDLVLDTNLKGIFHVTKSVIRPMMSQKRGKIINLTSVVALTGNPGQANYCASKAGVIGFTKSVAKEVASRGITVNAVAPGYVETDMTGKLTEAQQQALLGLIPLRRAGTVEDIANVVGFLASRAADYITGQTLVVDGGMAM